MSSVWVVFPSKRPAEQVNAVLALWRERGYRSVVLRECADGEVDADLTIRAVEYKGYAVSMNELVATVFMHDETCDWVVMAADDIHPDPYFTAKVIAAQCEGHFATQLPSEVNCDAAAYNPTWGVMQPTGDRWGENVPHLGKLGSAYIDRVCGSPWIGREFARRMYGGKGPLWPEYWHMYEDEELQEVALKYGVLWQRRDLIHYHDHWGRKRGSRDDMPSFLARANSSEEWAKAKALFESRKAAGFPGSEPIA